MQKSDNLKDLVDSLPALNSMEDLVVILRPIMKAIAAAVGPHCEVVLHDLRERDMEHTIYTIENGQVSGRAVGGPSTNLGLEVLRREEEDHNQFGYPGRTPDGRDLHCSSVYFKDQSGSVMAALCLNVDLTPLQSTRNIVSAMLPSTDDPTTEVIGPDINSVLDDMIEKAIKHVGRPVPLMEKPQRLEVLKYLEEHGAFFVKHSMERAAKRLAISKVTAYAYLDEVRPQTSRAAK